MGDNPNWRKIVVGSLGLLCIMDLYLGLRVVKEEYFVTTWPSYLLLVLDIITSWTGKIFWTVIILWAITKALLKGKSQAIPSLDDIIRYITDTLRAILNRLSVSIPAMVVLAVLGLLIGSQLQKAPPLLPPPSKVLISPDGKEVYLANERKGSLHVFDSESPTKQLLHPINLGTSLEPGKPQRLAIAPKRGEIYVPDARTNEIIVVDRKNFSVKGQIKVGQIPRWIAITPNQEKAYVSNEQPIPQGSITVIDLSTHQTTKTIKGVNCPEGLAITPDGSRLYVATQCGAGQDPVFVIDTATDEVIDTISGLAVGVALAITPDGKKIYVARGNFQLRDPSNGKLGSPLSVIDTATHKIIKTLVLQTSVTSVAITPDGKYALVGNGRQIDIIKTETDSVINTIPLATAPAGIAIYRDERAYVWLPDEDRIFLLGLSGLLQPKRMPE